MARTKAREDTPRPRPACWPSAAGRVKIHFPGIDPALFDDLVSCRPICETGDSTPIVSLQGGHGSGVRTHGSGAAFLRGGFRQRTADVKRGGPGNW